MLTTTRIFAATTAIALTGGLLGGSAVAHAPEQGAPDDRAPHIVVARTPAAVRADEGRSVAAYWTRERMASAEPVAQRVRPGDLERSLRLLASEQVAPGAGAGPVAGEQAVMREARRSKYRRRVGKLFLNFGQGQQACSASVVNSRQKNMLLTAAHCVWDKEHGWAKKALFIPGYKSHGDRSPFGKWYVERKAIPRHWKNWGGHAEVPQADYAILLVEKVGGGKDVAKKVGAYGLQWGRTFKRKFTATGYPAFGHHSGKVQRSCKHRSHKWKRYSNPRAGWGLLKMPCRAVTAGSSGGPWIHHGHVNGQNALVNGFKHPRWVASPWFAGGTRKLYKRFRNADPR